MMINPSIKELGLTKIAYAIKNEWNIPIEYLKKHEEIIWFTISNLKKEKVDIPVHIRRMDENKIDGVAIMVPIEVGEGEIDHFIEQIKNKLVKGFPPEDREKLIIQVSF